MITIALDEQGDFEGMFDDIKTGEPIFIGGVVFDDCNIRKEQQREKERIHHYLKGICETVGASYPEDLHVNHQRNNWAKVKKVKQKVTDTITEFMCRGTCQAIEGKFAEKLRQIPGRAGKYYVFVNMVCDDGNRQVNDRDSALIREDYGSNLYVHMAENVVERLIFHNPVIKNVNHVKLDLATRRVVLKGDDVAKADQYIRLGYEEDMDPSHASPGERIFCLTDKDNYRTAIQREMMDTGKYYIQFDSVGVKSIYYGGETPNYRMEFLYLADLICSNLGYKLPKAEADKLVWEVKQRADQYTGHDNNLIFVHDRVDAKFRKAWEKLEERDYYHTLSIAYDISHSDLAYADFYKKVWVKILEDQLKKENSLNDYNIALQRLHDYTRQNNIDQDKLIYIFSKLEDMKEQMEYRRSEDKAVLYKLYDAGVSAYCHVGRTDEAKLYFEQCKRYAKYADFETYLRTRTKLAVCLTDELQYEDACKLAKENKDYYEELMPLRQLILEDDSEGTIVYGIICSQLGQVYAFLRNEQAEAMFQKALKSMGNPESANYLITVSYLLHYYLDRKMQKEYEELAAVYFAGKRGLREQFSYILSEGTKGRDARLSMKFALYVFVRAIAAFYMERLSDGMLRRLLNIEEEVRGRGSDAAGQLSGHPWELIYKYLALIAYEKGREDATAGLMQKSETMIRNQGMIIDMIGWFGRIEVAMHMGQQQKAREICRCIPASLDEHNPVYRLIRETESFEDLYRILDNHIFTYMYR